MIYHCKWILLQALHMRGLKFIMQSMTACILSLPFSYILKLIYLMNFDGSSLSPVWNMQWFSTDHFRIGCWGLADHSPTSVLSCFPHLPTQRCYPPKDATPGKLTGWSLCPRATLILLLLWLESGQFWPASQELNCHCWVPCMIYLFCLKLLHKLLGDLCSAVYHQSLYLLDKSCWMLSLNTFCTFLHSNPIKI